MYPDANPIYKLIPILGNKEGISGSCIGGMNVGINRFISEERKKAAAEVIRYITSEEAQKHLLISGIPVSCLKNLYYDEEVCQIIDCELMRNIQPLARPNPKVVSYDDFSTKFRKLFNEFLFDNRTAKDVLNDINDIIKIYTISIDPSEHVGFIIFIVVCLIFVIIIISTPFLFMDKYKLHFRFMELDFWLIALFGLLCHLGVILVNYDEVTTFKCQLKFIIISFGFTFYFIPILHKLICNFPIDNKYSFWAKHNNYSFLFIFILLDLIINGLFMISPNIPYNNIINEGKNFKYCMVDHAFGIFLLIITILIKCLVLLAILFFLFTEWSMWETLKDVRLTTYAVSIDVILYILYIIISIIAVNHYIANFIISSTILIIFTLSNYIMMYGIRVMKIINNNKAQILFIETITKNSQDADSKLSENDIPEPKYERKSSISQKIISIHFTTSNISNTQPNNACNTFDVESTSNIEKSNSSAKI